MDMEEMALVNSNSSFEFDETESRIRALRAESEDLLDSWMERRNDIVNMLCDAKQETTRLFPGGPCKDELYIHLKSHEDHLNSTHWDLSEAIEYLQEYLHPSDEGTPPADDALPFASNFGQVAESSDPYKEFDREWGEVMEVWGEALVWQIQVHNKLDTPGEVLDVARTIDGDTLYDYLCESPLSLQEAHEGFYETLDRGINGNPGLPSSLVEHVRSLLLAEIESRL